MKLEFISFDKDKNKTRFITDYEIINDQIIFEDKSNTNTKIYLKIKDSKLDIRRIGNTKMKMTLDLAKKTEGYYKNDMSLEFEFLCLCHDLLIENNKIKARYDMIIDDEVINTTDLMIIMY